ncbi:MAG: cobyric acid synthase [Thermoleophilia bacterium]|nr:cobyric acid synthase [Thermoleophilia bacterium]
MLQGTASHAGKTLLVAGLARIMAQDGYSVAPFKSQNMSLNSYADADGGEMGRAQVVQAEAAGIEPRVDMNPVLLKPTSDTGSQVVVHGRPVGTMTAGTYHDFKMGLLDAVSESLERLRREFQVVIIEGAGSPAEVNFRGRDIANMAVAEMADAPVILIGDIERGGVFASMVGTMELLLPEEQERVAGLVINKFRGDRAILEPGLDFLEGRCKRPVLGVVPYIKDLRIEEEDSVALSDGSGRFSSGNDRHSGSGRHGANALWPSDVRDSSAGNGKAINVRAVRLPRISNFTDFDSLEACPGFDFRFAEHAAGLADADLIVIPGTKSTIADLRFLWSSGMAAEIIRKAQAGTPVIGICGGYQMLGTKILDPQGLDSSAGSVKGLGLIDMETVFGPEKETRQTAGEVVAETPLIPAGSIVKGYEIHMGRTELGPGVAPLLQTAAGADGAVSADGLVIGSYLHGFFDSDEVLSGLLSWFGCPVELPLLERGLAREHEYDRLARELRASLDMAKIYEIAGLA